MRPRGRASVLVDHHLGVLAGLAREAVDLEPEGLEVPLDARGHHELAAQGDGPRRAELPDGVGGLGAQRGAGGEQDRAVEHAGEARGAQGVGPAAVGDDDDVLGRGVGGERLHAGGVEAGLAGEVLDERRLPALGGSGFIRGGAYLTMRQSGLNLLLGKWSLVFLQGGERGTGNKAQSYCQGKSNSVTSFSQFKRPS